MRLALATLVLAAGCAAGGSGDTDRGPTDGRAGDGARDVAADSSSETESSDGPLDGALDGDPVGGPVTLVDEVVEVSEERLCDLDGDGLLDNAVADLGSPDSALFAAVMSTVIMGRNGEVAEIRLLHFPWVEDVRGPDDDDSVLVIANGEDLDDPPNPDDDLSGEEPFRVESDSLDACGEPTEHFARASLDQGALRASEGLLKMAFTWSTHLFAEVPVAFGHIAPGGGSGEVSMCIRLPARQLAAVEVFTADFTGSPLELLLAGGSAIGQPTIPGVTPDLDLDGDGLERFALDDESKIASCVDGDSTIIEGRDCWQDERMADGFSFVFALELVGAVFAGRADDWRQHVEGECEEPPEESLWDPR